MKKTVLIFILAAFSMGTFAQSIPGYLGKRFTVGYYAFLFPSFRNPNSPEVEYSGDPYTPVLGFSVSYQHHLVGEYVVTKKTSLVADIKYARTNVDAVHGGSYFTDPEDYSFEAHPSLRALGFAFGARRYSTHFAPLGAYTEYRIGYTALHVGDLHYRESGTEKVVPGGNTSGLSFAVGIGTQRIIADKWAVDFGLDFSFFSKGWLNSKSILRNESENSVSFDPTLDPARPTNRENLLRQAEGRFLMHGLMNFRIGVGLLP